MMRFVAVLLIALALGFCAPEPAEAAGQLLSGIFSPDAQLASDCDAGTDEVGASNAKTTVLVLSTDSSDIAPVAPKPSAAAIVRAVSAPDQIAVDAPASRAPPLA